MHNGSPDRFRLMTMRWQYRRAEAEAKLNMQQGAEIEALHRQDEIQRQQIADMKKRLERLEALMDTPVKTTQRRPSPAVAQIEAGSE